MAEKDSIRYIKNWWKFQHYKDRRPSWIKLYEEILDDAIIQSLTPPDFKRIITLWLRSSKHGGTLDLGQPNLWQTLGFGQRGSCSDFLERLEAKGLISKEDIRGAWQDDASEMLAQIKIQSKIKNKNTTEPNRSEASSLPVPNVKPRSDPLWKQWKGQGSVDEISEGRIRLCIHYLLHNNDWYKGKLTNFGFVRRMAKRMDDDTPKDYRVPKQAPKELPLVPDPACPKCRGTGQLKPVFLKVDGQRCEQTIIPRCDCPRSESE